MSKGITNKRLLQELKYARLSMAAHPALITLAHDRLKRALDTLENYEKVRRARIKQVRELQRKLHETNLKKGQDLE